MEIQLNYLNSEGQIVPWDDVGLVRMFETSCVIVATIVCIYEKHSVFLCSIERLKRFKSAYKITGSTALKYTRLAKSVSEAETCVREVVKDHYAVLEGN